MMPLKLIAILLAGLVLTASERNTPAKERAQVSDELRKRTGQGLRPPGEAPPARAPSLPPGVSLSEPLTEEAAVATALWNNAAFEAALSELGVARADLVEAGLLRNPTLQVLFPVGPKPFESVLQWPVEALWQRPRRVAAAKINLEAVSQRVVQHGLDLIRDVRAAHTDLALAERRAALLEQSRALLGRIAELTRKRLEAGDISVLEASLPELEARSAIEQAERARREVDVVRERLRLWMGLRGDKTDLRAAPPPELPAAPPEWPELLEAALASRPDLRAAELGVEAALKRARWERSRALALVAPLLSVKGVGTAGIRGGPGLAAELPALDWSQGKVSRADAEVQRAAAGYRALRDRVEAEIREARARYALAAASLGRLREEILPAARTSVRLAEKAYADGEASYLFVLEAGRQIYDLELREAEARAALRRAQAELERCVGRKS